MRKSLPPGPYLVLGCGRAGVSAAKALARLVSPSEIRVWDAYDGLETRRRGAHLADYGVGVELGPWRQELLPGVTSGTVVKSPGVPADCEPVQDALTRGITVLDELELGYRLSRRQLTAVTGTDGKSTVCALLARALGGKDGPLPLAGNTEFGPPISALPAVGGPAVIEVSSYQLEFSAMPFARLAVLTNLTVEHLHRHRTMSNYGASKRRLFIGDGRAVPLAAVNVDSLFGFGLARDLRLAGTTVATFGSTERAQYRVLKATWDGVGARLSIGTPSECLELATQLPGWHNAENIAAALAACDLLGLARRDSLQALATMQGVPGRWEAVDCDQPFDVVVDFAHTAAGLRQTLLTARHIATARNSAVRLVLCAGGANNPAKRGPLGMVASELADHVIITEGNGRGEPPEAVIAGLLAGWQPERPDPEIIAERRAAIRRALADALPGDVVILMGRGAMPRLLSDSSGGGSAFDDRSVAREELLAMMPDLMLQA
jgi:UDP-N-acetylmuramoyl-L-alanyl-D-glutamate--2,6-diaminopimelate ligase